MSADEKMLELGRQLRTVHDRYVYFLLAAAAGCVALALNRTAGSTLQWSMLPLGAAVLLWGASFVCGCYNRKSVSLMITLNLAGLKWKNTELPDHPKSPTLKKLGTGKLDDVAKSIERRASRLARWQFRTLVAGAVCYIAWHVLEMAARTPCPASAG